ncbi:RNase J1 [Paenibacillus sp. cl141a]|uniref:ribonuclease J1 n=1 Tax=Bacillales TaxID=1385 RepID=UPI00017881B7|nr:MULTISPECIES: ribonuclease J [Paenibacillus]ACX67827.1 beta-lactamase domain protein [Paenibacillus sp. Y412MC10]ETT61402.1 beta-lactamase domain-containing protein [Paenibacillus sp. FSL H8-457]PCL89809.1 RNase J family beta-CASP ribonuclease [Paenibacillus lautus]QOT10056.1 ribonuclease J [Paenibacillus sp. JNUCC-32]WFB57928.1 ribonuclease J [Paenibacillus sp. BR1-192]
MSKPLLTDKIQTAKPAKKPRPSAPPVRIFALGGLGEIGKNMYGVEFKNEIIIIDAGLKFPDAEMSGVDYIIPDIRYLLDNKHKVKGMFLTHGHEDHIGAIPYVLRQIQMPIYGGALTIGLVRAKLEEHRLLDQSDLRIFHEDETIAFRHLSVHFFRTTHSIPDAFGVVVETPYGPIVHTGDFKFDFTPEDKPANLHKILHIGGRGVLALMADSTNSERDGFTPSERTVGDSILRLFQECPGRILFATFASNVHRLQQVVEAAIRTGRKIAIVGRSMEKVFVIGQELGYIRVPDGMMIDVKAVNRYRDDQVLIICTGSQGEPNAALTRIASGAHRSIQIHPEDTVIFSSSPIPGNTQNVNRSIDLLMRAGAEVKYGSILDIHTSGHGCREDLKLMISSLRPKYFVPIHGEYRMMLNHRHLAVQVGVPDSNVYLMNIGNTLSLFRNYARKGRNIPSGDVYINNGELRTHEKELLEERVQLAHDGVVIVAITINRETRKLLSGPELITRGFVYMQDSKPLLRRAEAMLRKQLNKAGEQREYNRAAWEQMTNNTLNRYFKRELGRSPYIMPSIMEV